MAETIVWSTVAQGGGVGWVHSDIFIHVYVGSCHNFDTIQYNTKFIYIVGDTNSITLAMNSYLPT